MSTKIFLVGMPGAGKTTFGQALARALNWSFADLDHTIEELEGKSVTEIFQGLGETYFRKAEHQSLRHLALQPQSMVIATGGGAPCFHGNMNFMNDAGTTIFLNPPLETLEIRIKQENQRPLFHDTSIREKLEDLYKARNIHYCKARFTIESSNPDAGEIIEKLGFSDPQP